MEFSINHILYTSLGLLIISFVYYQLQFIDVNIEIGPIKIEAPKENVFNCFRNQFSNDTLWQAFDYGNTKEKIEFDLNKSNITHLYFTVTLNNKLFDFLDFRMRVILESEMIIDYLDYSINIKSQGKNKMLSTNYFVKLEDHGNSTLIKETSSFNIQRIFSAITKNVASLEHLNILNNIKKIVESDKNFCG